MSRPLILAVALVAACTAPDPGPQFFEGSYTWGTEAEGALEVVFTPNGKDSWNVDFAFDYVGNRRTWTGTARGNLKNGSLEGRVDSDNPELGYILRGEFRDGIFEGTHAELIDGSEKPSGTVRLKQRAGNRPADHPS